MSGFIDLHVHLLAGLDDGAKEPLDTLAMARALRALGFEAAAPSPHNRAEFQSGDKATSLARLDDARALLAAHGVPLVLHENAENFFLDERLLAAAPGPEGRRLAGTRVLLVEAPYTSPLPALLDLVFRLKLKGVTPLIAHPERCLEFARKGRAAEVAAAGALLQLDVGALTGRYGGEAKALARDFLSAGLYAVAATDLHSPKGAEAWVGEALEALRKAVGDAGLALLLRDNPRALLEGREPREGPAGR